MQAGEAEEAEVGGGEDVGGVAEGELAGEFGAGEGNFADDGGEGDEFEEGGRGALEEVGADFFSVSDYETPSHWELGIKEMDEMIQGWITYRHS